MITFQIILNMNNLLSEIIKFLSFKDKIHFSKYSNKNCLSFYNFRSKKYNSSYITSIFNTYDNEYILDTIYTLRSNIKSDVKEAYLENIKLYDSMSDSTDSDDMLRQLYIKQSNEKYYDEELDKLLDDTVLYVYVRKIVESIEDSIYEIKYDFNMDIFKLEEEMEFDINNMMITYYNDVFSFIDYDLFCKRCGEFGHHNVSLECLIYNKSYAKKIINEEVINFISNIIKTIEENEKIEIKKKLRYPLLCIACKVMNKKSNCNNNMCGNCCDYIDCYGHKKKITVSLLCLSCNVMNKKSNCNNNMCGNCCDCPRHKEYNQVPNINL